jgi:hypothetical protein
LDSGRFAVAYVANLSSVASNVYVRFIEPDGSFIGNTIKATDKPGSRFLAFPSITAGDSSRIVITWEDEIGELAHIFAQRFIYNAKTDSNFFIATDIGSEQHLPAVSLWNKELFSVWEDNRIEIIVDNIFASVLDFGNLITNSITETDKKPLHFKLHQNFPNPFNPSTHITFTLPKPENVKIEIYNSLGQKVGLLINQKMSAGYHIIQFINGNLSSGIYYYRIDAGKYHDVKKMALLK